MTVTVIYEDERPDGHPFAKEVPYEDLGPDVIDALLQAKDPGVIAWCKQTALTAAGDFNEADHPRGPGGKFAPKDDADKASRLVPLRGETVKRGNIAADLTLEGLPPKIQSQCMDRLTKDMGVTEAEASQNLTALFEQSLTDGKMAEYKDWYQVAHDFAQAQAERTGFDPQVVASIIAATSPGQSWETNQQATERVLTAFTQSDRPVSDELRDEVNTLLGKPDKRGGEPKTDFRIADGMTFGDVLNGDSRAGAILIGRDNGIQVRTYDNLTKAVDLARANDPAAIDDLLNGPKARSFYNNINQPTSTAGDVTVDSHMMEAMVNGYPGSSEGESRMAHVKDITSTLTGTPSYRNAEIGVYPVAADIIRTQTDAANAAHAGEPGFPLLPNQFQAAVWGEQINQYSPAQMRAITKANAK